MADDKAKPKTKIDLKARLGKTSIGGMSAPPMGSPSGMPGMPSMPVAQERPDFGPSVPAPPPVMTSGAPAASPSLQSSPGVVAPPILVPTIPLPPFSQPARIPQPPASKPTAAQQTIKIDVGEEIEQERKKSGKKSMMFGLVGVLIGGGIGFVAGGQKAVADRGVQAIAGAGAIEKDVLVANEKMKELAEKLTAAGTKLAAKEFPGDIPAALGAINVPFDAQNLEGKQVGTLPGKTLRALLAYTSAVQDLNKTKDQIRGLLTQAQAPITKAWADEKNPVATFSVVFRADGGKTVAELVTNKEPFLWKGDFPAAYTIVKLENNKAAEKKANRFTGQGPKVELVASDPVAIPVDPKTTAGFTSEVLIARLSKAIYDVRRDLEGNKDDPTKESAGLLKDGEDLAQELHKISLKR